MSRTSTTARGLRSDAASVLESDAGWHARLAARRIGSFMDQGLAPAGLSSTQFSLMCLVASAPDDSLGALAERAGLNQSTMSRNLDGLARLGWVEVATTDADRRRRMVWLTEAGARKLLSAMPLWREAQQALNATVSRSTLHRLSRSAAALAPAPRQP